MAALQFAEEPTALNSNLLPVNANGEVRFLSVLSRSISGILPIPSFSSVFCSGLILLSETFLEMSFSMLLRYDPRNTDMIAGGASCPPSLHELVSFITDALISSLLSYTAFSTETRKVMNCRLVRGFLPGDRRLTPVFVESDQLLCFPEPLIPA